jgi:AAA family ATP:ADP antiporter
MSNHSPKATGAEGGLLFRLLRRMIDVQPREATALAYSWLFFFAILSAYYVIRPIRDEMGVAGGVENLPWLFTGTLAGMTLFNPAFSALVARMAPARFISVTYRFFMVNLVLFFLLLRAVTGDGAVWVGRVFFIWVAIFNLFVISVFWGFMADVFRNEQSRRLFGFIAAGGTIGGIVGSTLTSTLVAHVGPAVLLLISAGLLELAVFGVRRLSRLSQATQERQRADNQEAPVGGSVLAGIKSALTSPYLLNISLYMLLYTILSTFLYFQQAAIARDAFADSASRTAFFANIDLAVNVLTLTIQLFITGRIVKRLGVAVTLTLLPALSAAGFFVLGLAPVLWAIVALQVTRRAGNFAVARPTREILYTVLSREDKYKAKSFIDTFVYRFGDQVGAWSYALMGFFGLGVAGIGFAAVPISLAWVANSLWLGRRQEKLRQRDAEGPPSAPLPASGLLAAETD